MAKQQQKNAHVPKFGNWDNDGNVPYTLYFENARKGKGGAAGGNAGKIINPNDPVENPEAFSSAVAGAPSPNRSPLHERLPSDAPPQPQSPNPYAGGGSPYHRHAGEPPRRGRAGGGGGGYSVDQSPSLSPLHPYGQSRADYSESIGGGGGGGLVANSVDRRRARGGARGNETPTRGSAVPKFGDWDSNPASADGYTHIFNKVREEKQSQAAGKSPGLGNDGAARGGGRRSKHHDDDGYASSSCSCFGWCK